MSFVFLCHQAWTKSKYDYGLFENFEITSEIFKQELPLVSHLRWVKENLEQKRKVLEKVKSPGEIVRVARSDIMDIEVNLNTTANDFHGAVRGFLVLVDTYDLEAKDIFEGRIIDKVKSPGVSVFPEKSRFQLYDLVQMALSAFNIGWYDHATKLTKFSIEKWNETATQFEDFHEEHKKMLESLKSQLPEKQNKLLKARRKLSGKDYKLLPYLIDENLEKKKSQPKFVKNSDFYKRDWNDFEEIGDGDTKENVFRRICGGKLLGANVTAQGPQKCFLLHHDDPYLKLGPFKQEIILPRPFRMIYHDFFTEAELQWLIDYSTPRLSRSRSDSPNNIGLTRSKQEAGTTRTIHKTVQVWLDEHVFNERAKYNRDDLTMHPLKDPYSKTVVHPELVKLSKKIEIATRMLVRGRWSSTQYQVTNYGLGGLCETHSDPHGYIEGKEIMWHQRTLQQTGDMLGTFMGWLSDVPAGGYTAYDHPDYEQLVRPSRGSAAFWINLSRHGFRIGKSSHGGCPVLGGSKWILNKWIYYYDQWHDWKCGLEEMKTFSGFKGQY